MVTVFHSVGVLPTTGYMQAEQRMLRQDQLAAIVPTTGYVQAEQRMLRQDQLAAIVSKLEALDGRVVLEAVQSEVGNGHHLIHFPERKKFWDYCNKESILQDFVNHFLLLTFVFLVIVARKENKFPGGMDAIFTQTVSRVPRF